MVLLAAHSGLTEWGSFFLLRLKIKPSAGRHDPAPAHRERVSCAAEVGGHLLCPHEAYCRPPPNPPPYAGRSRGAIRRVRCDYWRAGLRPVPRRPARCSARSTSCPRTRCWHHRDDDPAFGKRHEVRRATEEFLFAAMARHPRGLSRERKRLDIPAKTVAGLRARGQPLRRLEQLDGAGLQQLAAVDRPSRTAPGRTAWTGTRRRRRSRNDPPGAPALAHIAYPSPAQTSASRTSPRSGIASVETSIVVSRMPSGSKTCVRMNAKNGSFAASSTAALTRIQP